MFRRVFRQVSVEPKRDADGRVVGAVCVGEDVALRRRMLEATMENYHLQKTCVCSDSNHGRSSLLLPSGSAERPAVASLLRKGTTRRMPSWQSCRTRCAHRSMGCSACCRHATRPTDANCPTDASCPTDATCPTDASCPTDATRPTDATCPTEPTSWPYASLGPPSDGLRFAALGMLQLAQASDEPERVHRYIKQAKNSGTLLLHLINDILDITRIEAGNLALELRSFELREVCAPPARLRSRRRQQKLERSACASVRSPPLC